MSKHYSGNDPALGCGLTLLALILALAVIATIVILEIAHRVGAL